MKRKNAAFAALLLTCFTAAGMAPSVIPASAYEVKAGDLDGSGTIDRQDIQQLLDYLLKASGNPQKETADLDSNGRLDAADLSLLKAKVLYPEAQEPQHGNTDPSAYMEQVRSSYVTDVPQNILSARGGELSHITYFSKKANKEKGAHVWLPPGYDASKQYPVFYVNHGIQGNEFSMLGGFNIMESAAGLIEAGEAEPMIIVFTSMYTNPNKDNCDGITPDEVPFYDAFLEDLTESLMPHIESHYPCKTGRENTAIGGFSMGGRESLYIGIMRPDLFGYIAASSPAPGVVPAQDQFMVHVGSISEDQFRMTAPNLPYLLMIAGGTADGMVGNFPEQYHNLFTRNNTDHIWISVPGGGHDGTVGIPLFYNFIRALFKA